MASRPPIWPDRARSGRLGALGAPPGPNPGFGPPRPDRASTSPFLLEKPGFRTRFRPEKPRFQHPKSGGAPIDHYLATKSVESPPTTRGNFRSNVKTGIFAIFPGFSRPKIRASAGSKNPIFSDFRARFGPLRPASAFPGPIRPSEPDSALPAQSGPPGPIRTRSGPDPASQPDPDL